MKTICFDMDGTIVNLYGVYNWLTKLQAEDPSPYIEAEPLVDMEQLNLVLNTLINQGWEIQVISWLSKHASASYGAEIRKAKREWLERYNFPANKVHLIQYGATKSMCIGHLAEPAILIDDDDKVRDSWHIGKTINPESTDIIKYLWGLVAEG